MQVWWRFEGGRWRGSGEKRKKWILAGFGGFEVGVRESWRFVRV